MQPPRWRRSLSQADKDRALPARVRARVERGACRPLRSSRRHARQPLSPRGQGNGPRLGPDPMNPNSKFSSTRPVW